MRYEVGVQRQTLYRFPNGDVKEVMEVPVEFEDGSSFTLRIPIESYRFELVQSAIEARAQEHVATSAIRGEVS